MRKYWVLIVILLTAASAGAEDLTLAGAAELLIQHNPALAQKRLQAERAQEQGSQSRAAYLPQIDFVQNWTRSDNPVFVFGSLLNQRRFSEANFAIDALNDPAPLTDVSSRFQLGWLLYDFGRRESRVHSADAMKRIALLTEEAARTGLLQELVKRYYGVSLAQQRLATARDNHASAEARLRQASNRVEQGLAVAVEALSAEVHMARTQQELTEAENQVKLARAALRELLGVEGAPDWETAALVEREIPDHEFAYWQQQMREHRPELKIAEEGVSLAKSGATAARAGFLPAIQAFSAYEWHGDSLDYSGRNWTAGVELKWNLFRGMSDSKEVAAARLQEREAELRQRETQNALALQLESAYYKLAAAREKVKVASAVLQQAEENRRIYADRYSAGMASIQDSLQADAAYSESQLLHLQNLYEYYVAHAELLGAAGMPAEIVTGVAS